MECFRFKENSTDVLLLTISLQCSKTCGGGIITRILSCKKLNEDGQYSPVPKIFCQKAVKPPVTEACNDDVPCFGEYKGTGNYYLYP